MVVRKVTENEAMTPSPVRLFPEKLAPSDGECNHGISPWVIKFATTSALALKLVRVDGKADALPPTKNQCYLVV